MPNYITLSDVRYEFVQPSDFSYDEAREAQRITEGMGLAALERALGEVDPVAWLAVCYVTVKRVHPNVKVPDVEAMLRVQTLVQLASSFEQEDDEELPPAEARPRRAGEKIPDESGPPTSSTT